MGYKELHIKIKPDFSEQQLKREIERKIKIKQFSFQIISKSLDARNKRNIIWLLKIGVLSPHFKENIVDVRPTLKPLYKKNNKKVIIIGSGPAGFFCAYFLQLSGYNTMIIEKGSEVSKRAQKIRKFEKTGKFDPLGNYAFGEGGAGTFSDGKLTSRSKHISKERNFIIDHYKAAGAPEEITYLNHPHIGTDNLRIVVKNLREEYKRNGGIIVFETNFTGFTSQTGKVKGVDSDKGEWETDYLVVAPGHSSYETYKLLIKNGVTFRTKNFALGSRVEHRQEIINTAQWGLPKINGVKAAEYRLTSKGGGKNPVYSFCMCPGGIVVPATPYKHTNIVNGMSYYARNGKFANAACVVSVHPDDLFGEHTEAIEALQKLEEMEQKFFELVNGYQAPFCSIKDFLKGKESTSNAESSYPLGIKAFPLWEVFPKRIIKAMREGLTDFNNKIIGYSTGILLGLESKTSSPVQVIKNEDDTCEGFDNLYMAGEGSGYAGGIISSAADGVKIAQKIIERD